jgi:MFS family permease
VTEVVTSLAGGDLASALVVLLGAAAFVLFTPDTALPKELRTTTKIELWVSPRQHPDFAWAWGCHFMIQVGNALGTFYLLFFLKDAVHLPDPEGSLLTLMLFYGGALIAGAVLTGIVSDRSGRRKPYVLLSSGLMALAAILLVVWQTWIASVIAAALLGAGFGMYWAVALAILTAVLPAATDRAKDLGVLNIANALPQVFAPLIAPVIIASLGYPGLFGASAVTTLLAGVFIARIRSVR